MNVFRIARSMQTVSAGYRLFCWALVSSVMFTSAAYSQPPEHEKIVVKGVDGNPITPDSKTPYSPKRTCGACHDYDRITSGYHFQQGRTDRTGRIVISDTFDPKHPWNLSSGMFGKYCPVAEDASQLARKFNQHPSAIDKTSFFFIQNCGPCHPGGGFGEYDRKGNLYYNETTQKFGYEVSGDDPLYDGDYTAFTDGERNYGSPWAKSGTSEADCLMCHLKNYRWKDRAATLKAGLFKYAPAVGAGWGVLKPSQEPAGGEKTDEVTVDYTKKEIADVENLHLQIVTKSPDENCCACHGTSDGKKSALQWTPEADAHKAKGLSCLSCHPGDKEHNFAKGNSLRQTVRDDLNNTMYSCEDCHYRKKDRRAPSYRHPFSPRHMKRIACETCHIPFQAGPTDVVYDLASTGSAITYDATKFFSGDSLDAKRAISGPGPVIGYPQVREHKGRIVPVKSLVVMYWGDLDEKTNSIRPIFLWKIRGMKKPPLKDDDGDGVVEINSLDEIKAFLTALKVNDKFGTPIAKNPALVKGGFVYSLDKKGEIEKKKHDEADPLDVSLNHNIVAGSSVIGAHGCKDCHSKNSSFFLRKSLVDPFDERGKPVYMEAWERLGYDREKLGRLLLEQ